MEKPRPRIRLGGLLGFPLEVRQKMYRQLQLDGPIVSVEYCRQAREAALRSLQPEDQTSVSNARPQPGCSSRPRKKCRHDEFEDLMHTFLESLRKWEGNPADLLLKLSGERSEPSPPSCILDEDEEQARESYDVYNLTLESEVCTLGGNASGPLSVEDSPTTASCTDMQEAAAESVRPSHVGSESGSQLGREKPEPALSTLSEEPRIKLPSPAKLPRTDKAILSNQLRKLRAKQRGSVTQEAHVIPNSSSEQLIGTILRRKRFLRTEVSNDQTESESSGEDGQAGDNTFVPDYEPESPIHESETQSSIDDHVAELNECKVNDRNEWGTDVLELSYGTDGHEFDPVEDKTPQGSLQFMDYIDDESLCLSFIGGSCASGDQCNLPHVVQPDHIIAAAKRYSDSDDLKSMKKLIRNLIHVKSPVKVNSSSAQALELTRIAARCFLQEKDFFMTLRLLLSPKFPCVVDICEQLLALPECIEELPMIKQLFQRLTAGGASMQSSSLQRLLSLYSESGSLGKAVQFLDAALKLNPGFLPEADTCSRLKQLLENQIINEPNGDISAVLYDLVPQMQERTKELMKKLLPVPVHKLRQQQSQVVHIREYLNQANYAQLAKNFLGKRYSLADFVQEVTSHIVRKELKAFCGLFTEISILKPEIASLDRALLSALNSLVMKCLAGFLDPVKFESAAVVMLIATAYSLLDWVHFDECSPMLLLFSADICARENDAEHHRFFLKKFGDLKGRGKVDPALYALETQITLKVVKDIA